MLAGLPIELATLADIPAVPAPEEAGATFAENARAKAAYYAAVTGLPTIAEDSGLEIEAMGGQPGVLSARFGGVEATYPRRFALIFEALRYAGPNRAARFVCALAFARQDRIEFEALGTIEGQIAPEPRGDGGFGYDPIFFYPPFGCTLAEAGDRKSLVSHRAAAFRQLRDYLAGLRLSLSADWFDPV